MEQHSLQEKFKPESINYLFIAEAFPCSEGQFFYYENVPKQDNLFLYLIRSVFPDLATIDAKVLRAQKKELLERFKQEGYFIDFAVNTIIERNMKPAEKKKIIQEHSSSLFDRIAPYKSSAQIILLTANVFNLLYAQCIEKGFSVLNDTAIPYPGSGQQGKFKDALYKIGFGESK